MSATTSNKQKLRGRRKSKMSGKTNQNDCCETNEEVIQGASVTCDDTVNKPDPEKAVTVQDERSDVACSQKIVPTFKKLKRTRQMERKVCPIESSNHPHKRLKSARGSNKKSNQIVTTVQVHNEDKCGKVQPYTDPSNPGQFSRTEQQPGNSESVVKSKLQKRSVTQGQDGKVETPMTDFLKLKQVEEQNDQVKSLANEKLLQSGVRNVKELCLQSQNQLLETESDVIKKTKNSDKMSDNRSQSKDKDKDIGDDELVYSGCLGAENTREPGRKMESKQGLIEEHVSAGHSIGAVTSEDNFSDEQNRNGPECLSLSKRRAEERSIIPNKEKYRNENTKNGGKDHQTTYDNPNYVNILSNSLSDSFVPKIGQISKTLTSSIPALKVIAAIVVEQYKLEELSQEGTDQVKQDSSVVEEDLVSEPRCQKDCTTKDTWEMASCDLGSYKLSVTVNNKKCIDTGKETNTCIANLTSDGGREAAVSNILLEHKTDRGSEADTFSRPSSAGEEGEEISDSQLCAITTMDWTEEPLGPYGDTAGSPGATSPAPSTNIPDGTSIVKGLIREVSQLNMMLLRAKREIQTANQRRQPNNDNKTNMWTKK
ncbi:uncharacterized protein [Argopecten irradians]|uniref:uncharacterized protein n=1 Tax=Argopecten irradians TaxID=31199 RepID=UPI00371554D0